jgi:DNA-cytosine methyltransferase
MNMNVLSLFDGMSCGQIALERAEIKVDNYFASEIDKYAIKVTQANYPDTIQLGDITKWREWDLPKIDLILAGSPCQGFSFAGKQLAFDDPRSRLFFMFTDILHNIKAKNPDIKFLLENVKMKQQFKDVITEHVGYEPVEINSSLVSAQNRRRDYWSNIDFGQPEDKEVYLRDIIIPDVHPVALHNLYGGFKEKGVRVFEDKSPTLRTAAGGGHIPSFVKKDLAHIEKAIEYMNRKTKDGRTHWDFKHHSDITNPKSAAVVANFFKGVPYDVFKYWDCIRKFHPIECERLQTVPDNYTNHVSNTQRYKMLGNGWTVDVIVHILKGLL